MVRLGMGFVGRWLFGEVGLRKGGYGYLAFGSRTFRKGVNRVYLDGFFQGHYIGIKQ